jgi:hypothetical protein
MILRDGGPGRLRAHHQERRREPVNQSGLVGSACAVSWLSSAARVLISARFKLDAAAPGVGADLRLVCCQPL